LGWGLSGFLWADGAGNQAAPWAQLPDSTRQAALAGSAGALLDDLDSLGVNPAGLAGLKGDELSFNQKFWVQGLSEEHVAFGLPFGDFTLALGGDYLDFGAVNFYNLNASGLPLSNGTYTPTGLDLQAGLGVKVSELFKLGLNAKTLYQNLSPTDQAWSLAADLGLVFEESTQRFKAGLAIQNFGTTLDGASLPLVLDFSCAFTQDLAPGHRLSLTADGGLNVQQSDDSSAGAGVEYVYQGILSLRVGYRASSYGNLSGLSGLASGIGIKVDPFELGYAMTTLGDLGTTQEISLKNFF
jgi:hypothetical protein